MSCPWDSFAQSPFKYCEADLCGWVVHPADTWTNISYLLAGLIILKTPSDKTTKWLFAESCFLVFVCSTSFHATGTVFGEVADMYSMLVFSMLVLSQALRRLAGWSGKQTVLFFVGGLLFSVSYPLWIHTGKPLFALEILSAIGIEVFLLKTKRAALERNSFVKAIGLFAVALTFFSLDVTRMLCAPNNHFLTAHGIWHILCGFALVSIFQATINSRFVPAKTF